MEIKNKDPKIAAFLCNWCSYAGADLAGIFRYQYPPNLRVIKVMCSGRIDPYIVFDAFSKGIDGVMVAGCHIGDCHYLSGNIQAKQKMKHIFNILNLAKVPGPRFRLEWISASQGKIFSETINSFTRDLRALPPIKEENIDGLPTLYKMDAAREEFLQFQVRWVIGKEDLLLNNKNVYNEQSDENKINTVTEDVITGGYIKNLILRLLKDKPLSVKKISEKLNIKKDDIFQYIVMMKNEGLIDIEEFDDSYPVLSRI